MKCHAPHINDTSRMEEFWATIVRNQNPRDALENGECNEVHYDIHAFMANYNAGFWRVAQRLWKQGKKEWSRDMLR